MMRKKDGFYLYIKSIFGDVVLSERVPNVNADVSGPFMATHRAEFRQLLENLKGDAKFHEYLRRTPPFQGHSEARILAMLDEPEFFQQLQIITGAGELRVFNGVVHTLTNKAGTFWGGPENLQFAQSFFEKSGFEFGRNVVTGELTTRTKETQSIMRKLEDEILREKGRAPTKAEYEVRLCIAHVQDAAETELRLEYSQIPRYKKYMGRLESALHRLYRIPEFRSATQAGGFTLTPFKDS